MVWMIIYLPLCIWLGIGTVSHLNIYSVGGIGITVVIFALIELHQLSRDRLRTKTPLWIMCMTIGAVLLGLAWK